MHKLRLHRLLHGWTQIDLSVWSGIPVGKIHLIETGRTIPRDLDLKKLSAALGVCEVDISGYVDAEDPIQLAGTRGGGTDD